MITHEQKRIASLPRGKNHWTYGKKRSAETRAKISKSLTGLSHSEETKKKMSLARMGTKCSLLVRENMSKGQSGSRGSNWQGGISSTNERVRKSFKYKLWREGVFKRDNYTCQKYKIKGGYLHPHHIKNFAEFPDLRFRISNGITLSDKAHKEFHKIYGLKNNTRKQLTEFLND